MGTSSKSTGPYDPRCTLGIRGPPAYRFEVEEAEVGELLEIFQWLSAQEATTIMSDAVRAPQVREEHADVFGYPFVSPTHLTWISPRL